MQFCWASFLSPTYAPPGISLREGGQRFLKMKYFARLGATSR